MPWPADRPSPRNTTKPHDWRQRRTAVLKRDDDQCHICGGIGADQADHLIPVSQGGTHELANLAPIHAACAATKNAHEASAARWKHRQRRDPERHPGLLL